MKNIHSKNRRESMDKWNKKVRELSERFTYFAICRGKFGDEPIFHVVFTSKKDLEDFLWNIDDTQGTSFTTKHFYAQGYVGGEYIGENT